MRAPDAGGRTASRYAPLTGAAMALLAAGWLGWIAADWAQGGCECNDAILPAWTWVLMALAAALFLAAAVALAWRSVRSRG